MAKVFVIEGPDGIGKSTLVHMLTNYFNQSTSYRAIHLSSTQTDVGQQIKKIIMNNELDLNTELNLFKASLTHLFHDYIKPLMDNDKMIIFIDRWTLSTYVYQGYANFNEPFIIQESLSEIEQLFQPIRYFVLDAHDGIMDARLKQRGSADKFDDINFQQLVREGYRHFSQYPGYDVVPVNGSLDKNFKLLLSKVIEKLQ